MSNKEKQLKTQLVRTRTIIANKFRKLRRNQVLRDNELHERYAPITNSIKQLIDTKESISKENNLSDQENEFDEKYNLMKFEYDDQDDDKKIEVNVKEEEKLIDSNPQSKSSKRDVDTDTVKKINNGKERFYASHNIVGEHAFHSPNRVRDKNRAKVVSQRKKHRSNITDVLRESNSVNIEDKNDLGECSTKPKKKQNGISHKADQSIFLSNIDRFNQPRRKREILSPEDYDAMGNYLGPVKPKRRKIERIKMDQPKRRKHIKKNRKVLMKPDDIHKEHVRTKKSRKVVISPDDFDEEGYYRGVVAAKRRKVEIPIDNLKMVSRPKKRVRSRKCLEKKFIPYTENIVYEYYDDPNEIVNRLKLLMSSKNAGNSNHDQEINSIVEELRERHIIK